MPFLVVNPDNEHLHSIVEGEYIDLAVNPEGYTGYAGPTAHRVWSAIYDENCFGIREDHAVHEEELSSRYSQSPTSTAVLESDASREECLEKRVYYRVISGMVAPLAPNRTTVLFFS